MVVPLSTSILPLIRHFGRLISEAVILESDYVHEALELP